MTSPTPDFDKLFTVEEANKMLPLVRAIVTDLQSLYLDLVERQRRMDHLNAGRDDDASDPYSDELRSIESQMEGDRDRLRGFVNELRELGVECKDPARGLIDFPSEMDGEIVYLCWKVDEPEVLHWHTLDAGFAGRQSLTAEAIAGPEICGVDNEVDDGEI